MNAPIQPIAQPNLRSVLNSLSQEILARTNCHQVGSIVSFDPAKQTASVQIGMTKMVVDYTKSPPEFIFLPYPVMTDCPVILPSGGGGRLTFPIAAGDPCLVLFNDRDLDNWFAGGPNTPPNSGRTHDLSDGMVFVGVRNLAQVFASYNTDSAELAFAGGKLLIADKVALDGKDSDLKTLIGKVITALTQLDLKTGPSAATQIALVTTESAKLFQ